MSYLLDTHTLIWFITDDPNLPKSIREEIRDISNTYYISIASLWEMGIKYSLGKLHLKSIFELIDSYPFNILAINPAHILQLSYIPVHHRDPFDRLLIAQAKTEDLTIITKDRVFSSYDVSLKWN